jgi:uncharacterized damage-inducible protein DinB
METLRAIDKKFAYNDWANRRALKALRFMESPSSRAVRAFAHLLLVEKLWLARLRRTEMKLPAEFFPELPFTECEALLDESREAYGAFLGSLTEAELDLVSNFTSLKGDKYEASTRDVLTHVTMHSMYHRGQVALAIREDGGEPLQSDYILFVRETSDRG